jgi:hypothetical protein
MSKSESKYAYTGIPDQLPPSYARHQHACLTLNWNDRLRLIRFPEPIIDTVRQAILTSWHRGLQNERPYAGAYEFKLSGNPWFGQGVEAVESRAMMYVLIQSTSFSCNISSQDVSSFSFASSWLVSLDINRYF